MHCEFTLHDFVSDIRSWFLLCFGHELLMSFTIIAPRDNAECKWYNGTVWYISFIIPEPPPPTSTWSADGTHAIAKKHQVCFLACQSFHC
jgi:hypothetical protein